MTVFKDFKFLFFQNQGTRQTITKNIFWLGLAEGITRFLKLALIIYIAKILGATEYGKFTFALSFATLFTVIADFGLAQIVIREMSKDKEKEKDFSVVASLELVLALVSLFLIFIGSFFITSDILIRKLIWVMGVFAIVEVFMALIFSFLQARQKMEYQALTKVFEALLVTGAGFYVLFLHPSVLNLSFSYLFAGAAAMIIIILFFYFKVFPIKPSFKPVIWKNYLWLSWPLALNGLFSVIYTYTDSVMMGAFGQITQTGWYGAVQKIIGVTLIPIGLISVAFFPVLSKFFRESKEKMQEIWNYYFQLVIFIITPIIVGGEYLAQKIIYLVYDPSFSPAIFAFQILIFMAALTMLIAPFTQILIVFNRQRKIFWATLFGAIINVILNSLLIPKYSLYGAASATVISLSVVFVILFKFAKDLTSIEPVSPKSVIFLSQAILSSLAMYFVISRPVIYNLHIFLSILIGAFVYAAVFLMFIITEKKLCKS